MNAKMDRTQAIVLLFSLMTADAFVAPSQLAQHPTSSTSLSALPEYNPFLLADGLGAATRFASNDGLQTVSGSLSALRTFFIVLTAAVFGITALVYLTASVIVPKAAEQLERDTKRLSPGLWDEYEAKLEEGQTMANRPELLQELGNLMQPLIKNEYEEEAKKKFGDN